MRSGISTEVPFAVPHRPDILHRLLQGRAAGWRLPIGVAGIGLIVLAALLADVISPYDYLKTDFNQVLSPPSARHLLGTDHVGRDVLSRIIHGARVALQVGAVAVAIATGTGLVAGLLAGYFGGAADMLIMRLIDLVLSFPPLILILAITAALGPGLTNAMIAIGIVYAPTLARLVRGSALSVRETDFVQAVRALGASDIRIMVVHVLPNVVAPIIVTVSLLVANAILAEAGVSYLGLGVQPPTPSWGLLSLEGQKYLERSPVVLFAPGVAIAVTVICFNILGDGLRDVLDPRLR